MEGLSALHRRVAGIDVHRMLHVVTVLIEQPDGSVAKHSREFAASSETAVPWPPGWPSCRSSSW